jgi:Fe(3+) dicitrate transport protein
MNLKIAFNWLPPLLVGGLLAVGARAAYADEGSLAPVDGGAPPVDGGAPASPEQPAPPPPPPPPPSPPPASEPPARTEKSTGLVAPQVEVIGRAPRALQNVPGTASVVRREDLRQLAVQNAADALRTVPGINIAGEDPMGLRLNIGIRGLDPSRSRKVLVLEDGMPVSLNPYGSPELYYSPAIERMDRLEVVKGSGQILWGPQTIGGVINYITRDPPRRPTVNGDLRYGSFNYVLAQVGVGATHGPFGWRVDVIHRHFDGPRRLNLSLTDVGAKMRVALTPRSTLSLKLNFYDEQSRATYVGPTTPQIEANPRAIVAPNDHMALRRYAVSLVHQHLFSDSLLLQTGIYAYETARDWRRQEFDRANLGADYEHICDANARCGAPGDPNVIPDDLGGTLFFRRSAAIRSRVFHVAGVEPRLTWSWRKGPILTGQLTGLVRFHYERARTAVLVGDSPTAHSGEMRADEIRNGYALAAAIQNRFTLWQRLHITPGIRFEGFWSDRRIARVPVTLADGTITGTDTDIFGRTFSYALIPGIGISGDVTRWLTLYGGVHRGYAPPRTQDAVSVAGTNLELDPESSWNSELGARAHVGRALSVDVAAFHIEFENQIIPPSEAGETGGPATGSAFNTGHSRHTGFEATATFDFVQLLRPDRRSFTMPLSVNYTYLGLAELVGGINGGNRLPYAPEHLLYLQLRFMHRVGVSAQVGLTYVSSQFTDKENTPVPSRDGTVGAIDGYALLDARVGYTLRRAGLTFYVAGKNLTNQIYIASRAPQGIQPAGYLSVFGGIELGWPPSP